MKFCEKCGREIFEERFCPGCGNEIKIETTDEPTIEKSEEVSNNLEVFSQPKVSNLPKPSSKVLILIGVIAIAIIVLVMVISNSGPNLKKMYKDHCNPIWADVADDGSYLSIDTNPYDEEDNGIAYYGAYDAVEKINKELKLPDSVMEEMGHTTGADGKQSEEFDDVSVSWKYHPNTGLEVTYKKK